jgi:uncharacterized protein
MKYKKEFYVFVFLMLLSCSAIAQEKFELVNFKTDDGGKIEASLFKAAGNEIVIFAHGAIFNKESWYFLAEEFQKKGVTALPIDFRGYGNSVAGNTDKKLYDILGAITYAEKQGFKEINIIGASMGGAAVLGALSLSKSLLKSVVLLAPAGGFPVKSEEINKLFIVSKEEGLYKRVKQLYDDSGEPKKLKEYDGNAHAQHMFKTKYADELKKLIIDFVVSTD